MSRRTALLLPVTLGLALAATLIPEVAEARWAHVSAEPSRTSPFFVCPRHGHGSVCEAIEDPTRGLRRRGPVPAGAITAGPEEEASPAVLGSGVEGGYAPADLISAYRLPPLPRGPEVAAAEAEQTVAVVDAFDDPSAEADLSKYRSEYGLPQCSKVSGCFAKLNQEGGTSTPTFNAEWAREISLDLDMVSAICPNCHIRLVEAKNPEDTNLAAAENEAVALGASEISDSYAEPQSAEEAQAYDHPGIPIVASGGDEAFTVVSPAASQNVIAVGGTTLLPEAGRRGWTESVWWTGGTGKLSGTGSGCSLEPKPAWQTDSGCAHRTTNDIAAVADPNTPVSVYDGNETGSHWLLMGGTSVSAPIVAAAIALASPYTRSFEGSRALYLAAANGSSFNDIVSGVDAHCGSYLCEAGFGYDGPSGLGSLHGIPEVPPPTALTGAAATISKDEATVGASVNPHGVEVECSFEYGPLANEHESSAACSSPPGAGTSPVPVSAHLTGLVPGTIYHFGIAVHYREGAKHDLASGAAGTFTTLGALPGVVTGAASAITLSGARLNAQVNPHGATVTACEFEYGATTSYGGTAPCAPSPGAGEEPVAVAADLSGLTANTTYHYRVLATTPNGTNFGDDESVTLLPELATAVTRAASAVTTTSATLNATVEPGGASVTSCAFEFGSSESYIPCAQTPGSAQEPVAVSAAVSGLRPGVVYRYRIVATNASGPTYGGIEEFSSPLAGQIEDPLPPVELPPPPSTRLHPAEVTGATLTVNARGYFTTTVHCPAADTRCTGRLVLQTLHGTRAADGSLHTTVATIASGTFVAAQGKSVSIRMRLSSAARALLSRSHVLRARAITLTGPSAGPVSASRKLVTLRTTAARRT